MFSPLVFISLPMFLLLILLFVGTSVRPILRSDDKLCANVGGIIPNVTVMYVNLDRRMDRREQFETQLEKYFGLLKACRNWDWRRQSAFDAANLTQALQTRTTKQWPAWMSSIESGTQMAGRLGCYLSHLDGIEKVASTPTRSAFMFEDDYEFTVEPAEFLSKLKAISQEYGGSKWDVVLFGHNQYSGDAEPTKIEGVQRLKGLSWTTSSYLVNAGYISKLANVWHKHLDIDQKSDFLAVDVAWKELQEDPNSHWLRVEPRLGKQRGSFSDIELSQRDYGVLQTMQSSQNTKVAVES